MLINRDELSRKVLEGEITSLDDLNSVLRSMIKDVVETAMGAEMTGFLGYDRYQKIASIGLLHQLDYCHAVLGHCGLLWCRCGVPTLPYSQSARWAPRPFRPGWRSPPRLDDSKIYITSVDSTRPKR